MSRRVAADLNVRPPADSLLEAIADYTVRPDVGTALAFETARLTLWDTIGCGVLALGVPACRRLLGPLVPGTVVPHGVHVPGTAFVLDPVTAAFSIGTACRWLDYNDTWLAAEWGHPSDNLAAILAVAEYVSRQRLATGGSPLVMHDVLGAAIKAYEIQGVLALDNSFNAAGLDHVLLVRVASTALATWLLGGTREQVLDAVSNAWLDGGALRTYRHAPNTGSRKSWAAGDAAGRAVRLALLVLAGEMGYPSALSAPTWGFQDALFGGRPIVQARPFGSYVMENVLFKVAYPAEFHAQTAVEAAMQLHPLVVDRLTSVERVQIDTQAAAVRIISKVGPLHNPADRDHCLQYIVAVGLLFGTLSAEHYEDPVAADPRLETLRSRCSVREEPRYSADYLDPEKRSISNALQVVFDDGTRTPRVEVAYPLGHRRRRDESRPLLAAKLAANLASHFRAERVEALLELANAPDRLSALSVPAFMELLANPG